MRCSVPFDSNTVMVPIPLAPPAFRASLFAGFVLMTALPAADIARAGDWGIELDNDRIVNTDRHFTHGTRLFWHGDLNDTPD
jgi:hypothetical protein